jgi:hypothetical protein
VTDLLIAVLGIGCALLTILHIRLEARFDRLERGPARAQLPPVSVIRDSDRRHARLRAELRASLLTRAR